MSKVKGNIFDLNKTKLRGNLRRIETKKKKAERLKKSKSYIYKFQRGYYAKDWKYVGEYKLVEVPETYVDTYHIEKVLKKEYDNHGTPYYYLVPVRIVDGKKRIPAHTEKVRVNSTYIDIPARPVRINTGIKKYRKLANRKFRRCTSKDEIYNGGLYKKFYDIDWEYI